MVLMVPQDSVLWPSLGEQVCDWIEDNLCFGPGDLRGEPARVDDDKRLLIYRMYEVFPQKHPRAGRRRFKRVGISLPKGLAKTEMAAWIAAAELHPEAPVRCVGWDKKGNPIGGPVTDPYIPMVAYTEEQSDELAYGALRTILEASPVGRDFDIGLERIVRRDGGGKAVSLAAAPSSTDGARTTFAVCDETHWWTLPRLKQAHQTMLNNLAKRKQADPWTLEITTAPEPGTGSVAEATMDYATAVNEGHVSDSTLFYFHRQASDEHDLSTEDGCRAAVIEASGAAAAWRDIDAIMALRNDPTTDMAFWERVWCNRLVKSASQAFDIEAWKRLATERAVQPGAVIVLGFDGAMFHDSTALVATEVETGFQWLAGLWECPLGAGTPERPWQVPIKEVDARVREYFNNYRVWRMYADPPYWREWIASWSGDPLFAPRPEYGQGWEGARVVEWYTTRRKAMTGALESFDTAIRGGTISHNGGADVIRHLGNSRKEELATRDEAGKRLWLIRKERLDSPHKIDAAMASVLSWEARRDAVAAGVHGQWDSWVSSLESRGIRRLGQ